MQIEVLRDDAAFLEVQNYNISQFGFPAAAFSFQQQQQAVFSCGPVAPKHFVSVARLRVNGTASVGRRAATNPNLTPEKAKRGYRSWRRKTRSQSRWRVSG